jgi:hypothetical protein
MPSNVTDLKAMVLTAFVLQECSHLEVDSLGVVAVAILTSPASKWAATCDDREFFCLLDFGSGSGFRLTSKGRGSSQIREICIERCGQIHYKPHTT